MIGTSCRFCEFRVNDDTGKQNGCEVGLIEFFGQKYEATENKVEDHIVDDERGHDEFKIVPTICFYRRMPGWKESKKEYQVNNATFKDIARMELTLKVTAVVYLDEEQSMQELFDTLDELSHLSIPPVKIVIVNWSSKVKPHNFILQIRDKIQIPWAMETVLESRQSLPPGYNEGDNLLCRRAFDLGLKKVDTPFFIALKAGTKVPVDFIKGFEQSIIDDLEGVIMQESIDSNGPHFYQTTVYRIVGGNKERPVGDKIRDISKEQECQHLIKE